jgi:hypothetical protein
MTTQSMCTFIISMECRDYFIKYHLPLLPSHNSTMHIRTNIYVFTFKCFLCFNCFSDVAGKNLSSIFMCSKKKSLQLHKYILPPHLFRQFSHIKSHNFLRWIIVVVVVFFLGKVWSTFEFSSWCDNGIRQKWFSHTEIHMRQWNTRWNGRFEW